MFRFTSAKPEKESNSVCQITRFNLNAHTMGYIIPVLQKYSKFARFPSLSLYSVCMFASRMLLSFLSIALFCLFLEQSKRFGFCTKIVLNHFITNISNAFTTLSPSLATFSFFALLWSIFKFAAFPFATVQCALKCACQCKSINALRAHSLILNA